MTETSKIYNLGYYDGYIISNFVVNHIGIDLNKLGRKTSEDTFKVDLDGPELIDINSLHAQIHSTINFVQHYYNFPDDRPVWHRINVIDQAINQYIGIGFLCLETDWLKFVIDYLDNDRAEQGGDTIFSILDPDFNWAVSFKLIQDDNILKVEKYEK